ncbi:putative Duplicated ATPase component MtsB of energizing module of methionine-regulated ECF transporter (MtsB) [Oenococcus oeni]|uniref:ABC transporter ATP-binding protein n=1 Tax=Oenococcus oeni TaxID=1247 RepID=UPI00107E3AAF|nr:ABC transporter ATP-binding protein [Oenococcus oeni]AVI94695.1 heme ABC transporter ATP-binding protein [Oenococcus oeni]SYV98881.1 putative Duplicated ATPase component MtsB of energizing module of methionine-regulated ECF transporter (MtsB) [Oenococcus oeni]SYV99088.1 putative Duplicated ATPase component MtsB of energizing module of methionine-regulated ECF transporter (MtsB) [Oenococcus oeni]SYW18106.1 putative Duplicated ATPase component MtsB of energizing module of methionine-regulated 
MPAVTFKNVNFKYRVQSQATLHDVSFAFDYGEKIIIAGPSGSGKTTIGHLINGLIPQSFPGNLDGQILVNDQDVSKLDIFNLSFAVATVLQDTDAQFVGMTVAEDVSFLLENENIDHQTLLKKTNHWLTELNLQSVKNHHPQELSGGQKQRVSMAGVLSSDSKILLFDEPLANLDPAAGRAAIQLISQLQKKLNLTVIIIEHRLEEALKIQADKLVIVSRGKIIANDTPDRVLQSGVVSQVGLREPLYLTALKKAGLDLSLEKHLTDLSSLNQELVSKKISNWLNTKISVKKPSSGQPILSIKNLFFSYPKQSVFKDFNLDFYAGQITAIVGKNGSGKSTFSNLVTGFLKQDSGQIFFDGQSLDSLSVKERADKIGYVLQNPNQMISQNIVFDEVAYGLKLREVDPEEIKTRVRRVLKISGLDSMRHWPVSALSFGQKKRVTIASVLVLEPQILLLDEPTAGQDYLNYRSIMNFVASLNREHHTSIIVITHDMHLMLEYADRALALVDGKILADDRPAALLSNLELLKEASLAPTSLYNLARFSQVDPIKLSERLVESEADL